MVQSPPFITMKFWLTAYVLLFASLLLLAHEWVRLPDGKLHVELLDIGQGDGILITTPVGQRILVDGGPDLTLLERLGEELPFLDRGIDLMILTHSDADHVTSLPAVIERYKVKKILMTGVDAYSSRYRAFLDAIDKGDAEVILADSSNDIDLGDGLVLDVLWPIESMLGQNVEAPNNASIVAKLIWKDHEVLLTGDIEEEVERELLVHGVDVSSDILKVAHHGSKTSSSTGFLLAVNPDLALISVGKENNFGHPHQEILDRYENMGIKIKRTDKERVEVVFN